MRKNFWNIKSRSTDPLDISTVQFEHVTRINRASSGATQDSVPDQPTSCGKLETVAPCSSRNHAQVEESNDEPLEPSANSNSESEAETGLLFSCTIDHNAIYCALMIRYVPMHLRLTDEVSELLEKLRDSDEQLQEGDGRGEWKKSAVVARLHVTSCYFTRLTRHH